MQAAIRTRSPRCPRSPRPPATVSLWLLLKVFSSGCTAMTGVEAVSNGVMAFRDDTRKNAKITLTIIIVLLAMLLAGIALLCRAYGIAATNPNGPGYESVLSMLTRAVMGHGCFYYVTIGSVLLVLALSANTAFADFPRLTRAIALDRLHAPRLSAARPPAALLLGHLCAGGAHRAAADHLRRRHRPADSPLRHRRVHGLHPLAGRHGDALEAPRQRSRLRMFVNGLGAVATGITTMVVLVAKFAEGAWITALLIAVMIMLMRAVKRHYAAWPARSTSTGPSCPPKSPNPSWCCPSTAGAASPRRRSRFALSMSNDIRCLHVQTGEEPDEICKEWEREDRRAAARGRASAFPNSRSCNRPSATSCTPVVDYILKAEQESELPQGLRAGAGAGGAPLVGEPAAQPPRRPAESHPADARQPPHRRHQHSLVPRSRLTPPAANLGASTEIRVPHLGAGAPSGSGHRVFCFCGQSGISTNWKTESRSPDSQSPSISFLHPERSKW